MEVFEFIDSKKDQVPAASVHLSIQVCNEYISFALQQDGDNRLLYLKHLPFESTPGKADTAKRLKAEIEKNSNIPRECGLVKVIWISPKYSLVPGEMYAEEQARKLYELTHPLEELDELHMLAPKDLAYRLLFNVPQEISQEISRSWPSATYYNQMVPFMQSISADRQKHPDTAIYTESFPGQTDIVVFGNGQLKLATAFSTSDKNDWLYCMLNVIRQFDLSQATAGVASGDHFLKGLSVTDSVKPYFRNFRSLKPAIPQFNLSIFQSQDVNRFVNLLTLVNCG